MSTGTPPDWVVVGAGSVGLHLAARLARVGGRVLLVTRRPETTSAIADSGIEVSDPADGSRWSARVDCATGLDAVRPQDLRGPVLVCTRVEGLGPVATTLAQRQTGALPVCAQNGVGQEARLTHLFDRVLGLVVRQTSTRVGEAAVRATGRGRCIVGAATTSSDRAGARVSRDALSRDLVAAGFDVGVSDDLDADRWLKLCINLMSAPNALVRREDHATRSFVELKARILEEARDALRAANIDARSCDGRDRSLDEEIEYQRRSIDLGTSARALPIYNAVWTALRRGGPFEATGFHGRIVQMAERHGLDAPLNRRMIEILERSGREGLGPEHWAASELLETDTP